MGVAHRRLAPGEVLGVRAVLALGTDDRRLLKAKAVIWVMHEPDPVEKVSALEPLPDAPNIPIGSPW